jgi:hypothetical protein
MTTRRLISILAAGLALTSFAAPAAAEPRPKDGKAEQGYAYTFDDDPLSAPGMGALNGLIKVRAKSSRNTLTKPRLHFITEMLKSVEAL